MTAFFSTSSASRRALVLALPLLCSLALASLPNAAHAATTGSGRSASEPRSVAEFQAIALSGSMDLTVTQGDTQQVQVQADDNLLPLLETNVESTKAGSTLVVRWKKGENLYHRSKVLVTVTVPRLSSVVTAGSGDVRVDNFKTPGLKLSLSGSGDAKLNNLTTEDLGVRISGSGDVGGKGSAGKVAISIAGSGNVSYTGNAALTSKVAGSGSVNRK